MDIKQFVHIISVNCGNRKSDDISSPVFRRNGTLLHLSLHFFCICTLGIHLIDGNEHRTLRSLGKFKCFVCLWHKTIVSSDYQN